MVWPERERREGRDVILRRDVILAVAEVGLQGLGLEALVGDLGAPEDEGGLLHLVGEDLVDGGEVVPDLLHHPLGGDGGVGLDVALDDGDDALD